MLPFLSVVVLASVQLFAAGASACKGCISLDEHSFEKIVPKFNAVVVKFDVAYPYGEKHDTYTKLAEELAADRQLLFAEVPIKDYGERDNEALAKRYGIDPKTDLPAVRLFLENVDKPFAFAADFKIDNLRTFLRDNTGLYIGLPGCSEPFDKLAMDFVKAADKKALIKKAEDLLDSVDDEADKEMARYYIRFMEKIAENVDFPKNEEARLNKILKEAKVNDKKRKELNQRLNILKSFTIKPLIAKEEL